MKKIILLFFFAFFMCSCMAENLISDNNKDLNILTLSSSPLKEGNNLWVGTFQLVFNDMKENVLKLDKIEFVGEDQTLELKGLNNKEFDSTMLNESSYYTSYGKTSPKAKEEINKGIRKKFSEKSDIVNSLDWSEGKGRYYAYAMLKKSFSFKSAFDELEKDSFNGSANKFDYFGISSKSKKQLDDNVRVLYYNDKNDYAVSLLTKEGDIVYLYRYDNISSLQSGYKRMLAQSENFRETRSFQEFDTLKIPNLKIKGQKDYKELCNKQIKGTDLYFSTALETIELDLDRKGGKVKSEAILMTELMMALPQETQKPRHFDFDKPFVLFLIDKDKNDPYLALFVKNLSNLQ